ncbi:MAG: Dam family site-specific DNA-(adenine-N6)-methyltransferase [Chloroflexi bacterium]|nr:MAG: Dam family site-specific DNA-(adenine-N6)-methyltransferase [Chloroflexota bacterium]
MKVRVPPVKCQGIKTKLVPWILSNAIFPKDGFWIEPFMGSGVVGFNAYPERAVFNDLNPHIINFYKAIQDNLITPSTARKYLSAEGERLKQKGDEYFYRVRERFNQYHDPLDFLFLSRASFNGMIRFNSKGEYNVPFCKKRERFSKAYITKIVNQIAHIWRLLQIFDWEFRCGDFEEIILMATSNDFIYCDPPYYGRHIDYYDKWDEAEENRLFRLLNNTPARFILSTWHSNKYRKNSALDKYQEKFFITTKEHFYHIGAQEKNRNSILEALVMNYPPPVPTVEQSARQLAFFEDRASYSISAFSGEENSS